MPSSAAPAPIRRPALDPTSSRYLVTVRYRDHLRPAEPYPCYGYSIMDSGLVQVFLSPDRASGHRRIYSPETFLEMDFTPVNQDD